MGSGSTSSHGKALEGVHGIHVVPHSPFAIEEITKPGDLSHRPTIATSISRVNQRLSMSMQRVWQQRPGCLRPIHCSMHGDQHLAERAANILTSLPFVALGLQAPRKNSTTKLYANSLIGVGVASCLYHSSRGNVRKYMKWLDYTMIATATVCLSRALRNENPKLLMAATAALLPIQPVMVSAIHTGMMEVVFAKRALEDPDLRMAHNVHKMSSLLGGVLFVADDIFPQTPFLHAGWHLAAAVGVGTCNKLLDEPLSMWMPDGSNNRDLDINSSVKLTKYMRSTKLKPAFCGSTTNFAMAAPSCSSYGYVNSVLAGTNHCHANGTENYKMELINEQQLGNGRWNPTPEQLHALEELYRCGKRTPTLDEIQYIASKLRRYGKIEGKNVFYWFQNHKARDRLKRHREDRTSCERPEHGHQNLDNQECAGLSRKAHKLDHAKNSIAAPFFCKNFEVNGAAISMDRARAWSHFVQRDCHQKTGIVSTRSTLLNYEDYSSLLSKSKRSHHFQIHDKDETSESQTLQLFPLNSVGCSSTDHKVGSAKNDAEVPIKTINTRASACQFFEFLPLKN